MLVAVSPRQAPRDATESKTAKVWPVKGTGLNGSGIATCAIPAIKPTDASTSAISRTQASRTVSTSTRGATEIVDIKSPLNKAKFALAMPIIGTFQPRNQELMGKYED
jgi:hypothetical protein